MPAQKLRVALVTAQHAPPLRENLPKQGFADARQVDQVERPADVQGEIGDQGHPSFAGQGSGGGDR